MANGAILPNRGGAGVFQQPAKGFIIANSDGAPIFSLDGGAGSLLGEVTDGVIRADLAAMEITWITSGSGRIFPISKTAFPLSLGLIHGLISLFDQGGAF